MSFFKELGEELADVVTSTADRIGGNIQAGTDENRAKVQILEATADKVKEETRLRREREKRLLKIVEIIGYALVFVVAIFAISRFLVPALKK